MPPNTIDVGEQFELVEVLRNAEGLIVVISRKKSNRVLSCALFKEFEREGRTERSTYFQRRQIDAAVEILKLAAEKMDALVDADKAAERARRDQNDRDRRNHARR